MKHILNSLLRGGMRRTLALSLAVIMVFVTTYTLVLPALTLDDETAEAEPGIVLAQAEPAVEELETSDAPAEASEEPAEIEYLDAEEPAAPAEVIEEYVGETAPAPEAPVEEPAASPEEAEPAESAESTETPEPAGAEQTDEAPAEDAMPAQTFDSAALDAGTLIKVHVEAEEGTFPAGTAMSMKLVKADKVEELVSGAVEGEFTTVHAVDITFKHGGQEIEPAQPVRVSITSSKMAQMENPTVVHITENENKEQVATALSEEKVEDLDVANKSLEFEAESFSIYVIVDGSSTKRLIYNFYNGNKLLVTEYVKNQKYTNDAGEEFWETLYDPGLVTPYGKRFVGWSTNPNATSVDSGVYTIEQLNTKLAETFENEKNGTSTIVNDTTIDLYAIFETAYYLRYLNQDEDGTITVLKTEVVEASWPEVDTEHPEMDRTVTVSHAMDLSDGEVFEGWYDPKTGETYSKDQEKPNSIVLKDNLDLYLKVQGRFWLVYNDNDGGITGASYTPPQLTFNQSDTKKFTVKPEDPTWKGYTFTGWNTKPDGKGVTWLTVTYTTDETTGEVTPVYSDSEFGGTLSGDVVLYAQWSADSNFYRIAYWRQKETDAVGLASADKTYDFYGYREFKTGVKTGDTVTAEAKDRDMAEVARQLKKTLGDENKFYYNADRSDTGSKTVAPDGSTVINIYFDRETMTFIFDQNITDYTETTDTTGELYGRVNGQYVRVYSDGNGGWTYSQTVTKTYSGTRYVVAGNSSSGKHYGLVDGLLVELTGHGGLLTYKWQYKDSTNQWVTYSETMYRVAGNDDSGTKYGLIAGKMVRLNNNGTYTATEQVAYSGTLYKAPVNQLQGLYGAQMKSGEWPDGEYWKYANNTKESYGDASTTLNAAWTSYTISTNAYEYEKGTKPYTTWHLYKSSHNGAVKIVYWKQAADGTYPEQDAVKTTGDAGTNLNIGNNKFYGFTVLGWQYGGAGGTPNDTTGDIWKDLSITESHSDKFKMESGKGDINIYYARDKFDVTFQTNDTTSQIHKQEGIYYGASLADLEDYVHEATTEAEKTDRYMEGKEGYYFAGWYADANFTKKFDFTKETMPHSNLMLFAKWDTYRVRLVLVPTKDNAHNEEVSFANNQALAFRLDYNEKISDANISSSVAKRTGYKLIGWYTSPTFEENTLWNFDTQVNNKVTAVDMNYQQSEDWANNTYKDNDGEHDNVEGILKLYAKWELSVKESNFYVEYEVPETYLKRNALGNLQTTIPVDDQAYLYGEEDAYTIRIAEGPTDYQEAYEFKHWVLLNADGTESTKTFSPGEMAIKNIPEDNIAEVELTDDNGTVKKIHVVKLLAVFETSKDNKATQVTFDGNGGKTKNDEERVSVGVQVNATLTTKSDFYRKGYKLLGWAFDPDLDADTFKGLLSETDQQQTNGARRAPSATAVSTKDDVFGVGVDIAADNLIRSELNSERNTLYAIWEILPMTITVTKVDDATPAQPLKDVGFTLYSAYDAEDNTKNVVVGDGEAKTDDDGKASFTTTYGEYTLVETTPPENYTAEQSVYVISESNANVQISPVYGVDAEGKETSEIVSYTATLTVVNYSPRSITVKKVSTTSDTGLPGAQFKLQHRDSNNEWVDVSNAVYTTGSDGTVSIANLAANKAYRLAEQHAPDGYLMESDAYFYFEVGTDDGIKIPEVGSDKSKLYTVSEDGKTLIIQNTPGQALPHTGGEGVTGYTLTGLLVMLLGLSLLLYKMSNPYMRRRERRVN